MSNIRATYFLFAMLVFTFFIAAGCDSGGNTPALTPTDSETSINSDDETPSDDAKEEDQNQEENSSKNDEDTVGNDTVSEDPTMNWKTYESEEFTIKYPPNWETSEGGGLYRWHQGIEEEFASQDYFEDIGRLAKVSLGFVFLQNDQNKTLEELWNEVKADDSVKEKIFLGEEPALTANCSGIVYMECVVATHKDEWVSASILYASEDPLIRSEIRQMLETFSFAD